MARSGKALVEARARRRHSHTGSRKTSDERQALDAIEALVKKGRGDELADTIMGLSGTGARAGAAAGGLFVSALSHVDPSKLPFEHTVILGQLIVALQDSGSRAQLAVNKAPILPADPSQIINAEPVKDHPFRYTLEHLDKLMEADKK